ncbi:hypothetical protein WME91_03820 [Sorangium sp. So ce269]
MTGPDLGTARLSAGDRLDITAPGEPTTLGDTGWEVLGGEVEHRVSLVGAAAGGALSFASGHGLATLGAGASVLHLRYDYDTPASQVFNSNPDSAWAAFPHLEAAVRWFVHDHAGFRLGGLAGAAFPTIDIPHPKRNVGSIPAAGATRYGQPLLAVSLSLEARF